MALLIVNKWPSPIAYTYLHRTGCETKHGKSNPFFPFGLLGGTSWRSTLAAGMLLWRKKAAFFFLVKHEIFSFISWTPWRRQAIASNCAGQPPPGAFVQQLPGFRCTHPLKSCVWWENLPAPSLLPCFVLLTFHATFLMSPHSHGEYFMSGPGL